MPLPGPSPAIHAALCSPSSARLSSPACGGSLPPLLWWQVPSEVFNHLSCKTPFNWNYPLADKLLEPYQAGDIVAWVFSCWKVLLLLALLIPFLIVFFCLYFSPVVRLFPHFCFLYFFLDLFFSRVESCPVKQPVLSFWWYCCCSLVACNMLHDPVSTLLFIWHTQTCEALWHASPVVSCQESPVNKASAAAAGCRCPCVFFRPSFQISRHIMH